MNTYIQEAIDCAKNGMNNNEGGPFGAVVVDKMGRIIGYGNNKVLINNDPTVHAEVVAIRDACRTINNYNLEGCKIYSTSEPCPMCLSAIIWSNIKEIYYVTDRYEVENIGFRDNLIYDFFNGNNNIIKLIKFENKECNKILEEYKNKIY